MNLYAAAEPSVWTPAFVMALSALITTFFTGIGGLWVLVRKLKSVHDEFNGRMTEAIEAAKVAAEKEVRAAFARGVLTEKEGTPGQKAIDPEILEKAYKKLFLPGNGEPEHKA